LARWPPPPAACDSRGFCHSLQPGPGSSVLPLRVSMVTLPCARQPSVPNFAGAWASNTFDM